MESGIVLFCPTILTQIVQSLSQTFQFLSHSFFFFFLTVCMNDLNNAGLLYIPTVGIIFMPVCFCVAANKDPGSGPLATTAASGNPALPSTPLQLEQLLASSKMSTPLASLEKKGRDPSLSPEAVRVLDSLPELAFLSARMLMFPVQGDSNVNKL